MRRSDLIVVVTSVGSEEQALDIAHALIRNRQAACVNILPNVHSIYRWKGRVCDDGEFLLLVKTRAREFVAVCDTIQKINTYELPEILAYRVDEASPAFLDWISRTTERPKRKFKKTGKGARSRSASTSKPPAPIPIRRRASSR
jgi:periplasmic divalent cation tolerance protein